MTSKNPAKKRKASAVNGGGDDDEWLALNVSGTRMFTKRATLLSGANDSVLSRMFDVNSPFGALPRDDDGAVLLDRDAEAFQWILGVLRRGGAITSLPPQGLVDRVKNEADYFGLDDIVRFIDERPPREYKCISESVAAHDEAKADTKLIKDGWSVTSMNCVPVVREQRQQTPCVLRTLLLEREAPSVADNVEEKGKIMSFRVDGLTKEYSPAKFGAMKAVSALTAEANPLTMSQGRQPILENPEDLAGKVAVASRGGCSFLQKARLAMEAGAVALVVRQFGYLDTLERMEAADANEAERINIPVIMVKYNCLAKYSCDDKWVDIGSQVLW